MMFDTWISASLSQYAGLFFLLLNINSYNYFTHIQISNVYLQIHFQLHISQWCICPRTFLKNTELDLSLRSSLYRVDISNENNLQGVSLLDKSPTGITAMNNITITKWTTTNPYAYCAPQSFTSALTIWGLITSYDVRELGYHWLRLRHLAWPTSSH